MQVPELSCLILNQLMSILALLSINMLNSTAKDMIIHIKYSLIDWHCKLHYQKNCFVKKIKHNIYCKKKQGT